LGEKRLQALGKEKRLRALRAREIEQVTSPTSERETTGYELFE